jgi:hypothetical protein
VRASLLVVFACSACSSASIDVADASDTDDASTNDAFVADDATSDAPSDGLMLADADASDGGCFVSTVGTFGDCISTTDCAALGDHVSTPGYCPGPASIECCTSAPNVADNPPVPSGWKLMAQADVTPAMTTWAVEILDAPTTYPMFSTTTQLFGTLDVLARVEWHPPDFQNAAIHRGVTLYEPAN